MNRSLYPEGVEVHQRHLANTETTKAENINQISKDAMSGGVALGLDVTVNSPNTTRIDVAAGHGYARNGELLVVTNTISNIALANSASGNLNYVLLMYDEVQSSPEAHETDGTTRNTKVTVAPRLVVLDTAAYNALPLSDAILSNNALDRSLLLGIVNPNNGGPLSNASVTTPTQFAEVLQASQPTTIIGVSVVRVDLLTPVGVGTLTYTVTGGSKLKWKAPGDSVAGPEQLISASGDYTLASANGRFIVVSAQLAQLPIVDKTDQIGIANLYQQNVPRLTSEDLHHRSQIGSGVPTSKNPHGMTILDLDPAAGSSVEAHQDQQHSNGIWSGSSAALLQTSVTTAGADKLTFQNFGTGDLVYINGRAVVTLVSAPQMTFDTDNITNQSLWGVYLTQDATLIKSMRVEYPVGSNLKIILHVINCSDDLASGGSTVTKDIAWTTGGAISFDGGPAVASPTIDTVARLYSSNRTSFVDVYLKGLSNPGANLSETFTFYPEPSLEENFLLVYAQWSGSSSQFLGYGFGSENIPNRVVDKRVFGTLSRNDLATSVGQISAQQQFSDYLGDGIVPRTDGLPWSSNAVWNHNSAWADQFIRGTVTGTQQPITGGVAYLGGKRFEVPTTTITLAAGASNQVYINASGGIVTSASSWEQIATNEQQKPVVRLWEITTNGGGTVTLASDMRASSSLKKDVMNGIVGLNPNRQASVTAITGAAIYGTSAAGQGMYADGQNGHAAVQGVGISGNSIGGRFQGHGTGYAVRADSGVDADAIAGFATGASRTGVYGSGPQGVWGQALGTGTGVRAVAAGGLGVHATNSSGTAIYGDAAAGNGVHGNGSTGVRGTALASGTGVYGSSPGATGIGVLAEGFHALWSNITVGGGYGHVIRSNGNATVAGIDIIITSGTGINISTGSLNAINTGQRVTAGSFFTGGTLNAGTTSLGGTTTSTLTTNANHHMNGTTFWPNNGQMNGDNCWVDSYYRIVNQFSSNQLIQNAGLGGLPTCIFRFSFNGGTTELWFHRGGNNFGRLD